MTAAPDQPIPDSETFALATICSKLEALDHDARIRVLNYLNDRWGAPLVEYAVLEEAEPLIAPAVDLDAIKASIEETVRPIREALATWRTRAEGDGR